MLIAGYVPAYRQIWVIGDAPFAETIQHLQFWKDKADQDPLQAMYILKRYETKAFLPASSPNAVKAVIDALITALHERPIPPHTLCILLDDSNFWCDSMLLDYNMDMILTTLIREIIRVLETRTRDLPLRCVPDFTTKVIISKLTFRPEDAVGIVPGFREKRRKFNNQLDQIADQKRIRTISFDEITPKFSEAIFQSHGNLAKDGYRQIWNSLSNAIEDLDLLGAQRPKVFNASCNQQHQKVQNPNVPTTDLIEQYYTADGSVGGVQSRTDETNQDLRYKLVRNQQTTDRPKQGFGRPNKRKNKWFRRNNNSFF